MRSINRFALTAVALAAVVAAALTVDAAPASAHSSLAFSSPADEERFAEAPREVRLVFVSNVLELGAIVIVADATGRDWVAGPPVIDGAEVLVPLLEGMPEAGYEVRWRVVSEDGHPISDAIPFTVGAGERYSSVADAPPEPQVDSTATGQDNEGATTARLITIGGIGAAFAIAILVAIEIIRRRGAPRRQQGEQK